MSKPITWRAQLSHTAGPFMEAKGTTRDEAHYRVWDMWSRTYPGITPTALVLLKSCRFNEPQPPDGIELQEPPPAPEYPAAPGGEPVEPNGAEEG